MGWICCKAKTGTDEKDEERSHRRGEDRRDGREEGIAKGRAACGSRPSTTSPSPAPSFMPSPLEWPAWLLSVAGEALVGWAPRRANSFQRLSKIGQGTYSNVYRAKDLITGKIVALKKVRFDQGDPESIKFMAREITLLRRLDHPNIIKLEGLVTSRVSSSLYLVFEYMDHDLSGLAASPGIDFTLPQVKCYIKQLLSGLEHCHGRGVLHRDIKCANLLIDNQGVLKITDFGLAASFNPKHKRQMTSKVVTLWYRPPELILGATSYGPSVDLWSAGCILAELLAGKPILPGRTEVEQLQMIFRLCGPLPDEYWKKSKLPSTAMIKMERNCKFSMAETYKDFPASSLPLMKTLLSADPNGRGTASDALNSEFFTTEPRACEPESLPSYPPSKEIDARHRDEESRRKAAARPGKGRTPESRERTNQGDRSNRAAPTPEANAELRCNILKLRPNPSGKSEKFPPPHQDGALGFPMQMGTGKSSCSGPVYFAARDTSLLASSSFEAKGEPKPRRTRRRVAPSHLIINRRSPVAT